MQNLISEKSFVLHGFFFIIWNFQRKLVIRVHVFIWFTFHWHIHVYIHTTNWFVTVHERCLRFSYHMYGSAIGSLAVYFQGNSTNKTLAFQKIGDQGNQWNSTEIDIPPVQNLQVSQSSVLSTRHFISIDNGDSCESNCKETLAVYKQFISRSTLHKILFKAVYAIILSYKHYMCISSNWFTCRPIRCRYFTNELLKFIKLLMKKY